MTGPGRPGLDRSTTAQSAPGTATWLAERAVLGALLRRPERIADMRTWLKPQDFADPQHRGVFATIAGLHAAGELHPIASEAAATSGLDGPSMQAVAQNVLHVRDVLESQRFTTESFGSYRDLMTDLFHAGARTRAEQYTRYGQMVLEMSVRRQVEAWGIRLEHAATPETAPDGDLAALQDTHEAMMSNLADLAVQVRRSTGKNVLQTQRDSMTMPVVVPATAPAPRLVERAEKLVIHAVLAVPQWRNSGLLQRLRPEDFVTSPAHQNTWRAIQAVAARDEPVDPITVAWQAEALAADVRLGLRPEDRTALSPADLASMSSEPTDDVARAISTVARSALAEHARKAQRDIQLAAANRGSDLPTTLDTVRDVGTELDQTAQRLMGHTRPPRKSALSRALDGDRPTPAPPPAVHTPQRTR